MNDKINDMIDDDRIIQRPSDMDCLTPYITCVESKNVEQERLKHFKRAFKIIIFTLRGKSLRAAIYGPESWRNKGNNIDDGFILTIERRYPQSRLHWKGTFVRGSQIATLTGFLTNEDPEDIRARQTIVD